MASVDKLILRNRTSLADAPKRAKASTAPGRLLSRLSVGLGNATQIPMLPGYSGY